MKQLLNRGCLKFSSNAFVEAAANYPPWRLSITDDQYHYLNFARPRNYVHDLPANQTLLQQTRANIHILKWSATLELCCSVLRSVVITHRKIWRTKSMLSDERKKASMISLKRWAKTWVGQPIGHTGNSGRTSKPVWKKPRKFREQKKYLGMEALVRAWIISDERRWYRLKVSSNIRI